MTQSSELVDLFAAKSPLPSSRLARFDKDRKAWMWQLGDPLDLTRTRGSLASLALALCESYCHEGPHGEVVPPRADPRGLWVYNGRLWELVKAREIGGRLDWWDNRAFLCEINQKGKIRKTPFLVTSAKTRAAQRAYKVTPSLWDDEEGWFDSRPPCLAIGEKAYRVDLKTFELVEEDLTPEHGARDGFDALLLEDAQAPGWEAYLHQLFSGQEDVIEYLEAWCGFALLGATTAFQLPALILCGAPGTGKSTLASVIASFFPLSSVVCVPPHSWQEGALGSGLETLEFARLNVITDLSLTRPISDHAFLKRIIFGEAISVRPIYHAPLSFRPRAAHLWCANGLPQVPGADRALWDRFLPLPVTGPQWRGQDEENPSLAAHLSSQEWDGVLARMLRAVQRALEQKRTGKRRMMSPPQASLVKKTQWQNEADNVALWSSECLGLVETLTASCSPRQGWDHYRRWCHREGYQACTHRTWAQRMHGLLNLEQWPLISGSRKIPYRTLSSS